MLKWMACVAAGASLAAGCGGTPTGPDPVVPRLSSTRFLAFGDSLTSGEITVPIGLGSANSKQVVVPTASYPTLLQSQLTSTYPTQAGVIVVTNEGKPGEYAHDGARRFGDAFSAAQPQVVLLWEGVNSIVPFGMDSAITALTEMTIAGRSRGARVFVATMSPTKPGGRNSQNPADLEVMNTRIRAMATAQGAVVVNLYDPLLPDVNTVIGIDGLHPTEVGYRRIAELFFAAIKTELEVK